MLHNIVASFVIPNHLDALRVLQLSRYLSLLIAFFDYDAQDVLFFIIIFEIVEIIFYLQSRTCCNSYRIMMVSRIITILSFYSLVIPDNPNQ